MLRKRERDEMACRLLPIWIDCEKAQIQIKEMQEPRTLEAVLLQCRLSGTF